MRSRLRFTFSMEFSLQFYRTAPQGSEFVALRCYIAVSRAVGREKSLKIAFFTGVRGTEDSVG